MLCYACLVEDKETKAVTYAYGNAVCKHHVKKIIEQHVQPQPSGSGLDANLVGGVMKMLLSGLTTAFAESKARTESKPVLSDGDLKDIDAEVQALKGCCGG